MRSFKATFESHFRVTMAISVRDVFLKVIRDSRFQGETNGYDSRSNTLTMHTFRPYEGNFNNAYGYVYTVAFHWYFFIARISCF